MHGTLPAGARPPAPRWPLVLRLAVRELRAGLGGFAVFIACIALGVAAISGVAAVSRSLVAGVTTQSRSILGGDAAFALIGREASPAERTYLAGRGTLSEVATLRAMAAGPDTAALAELKAVDRAYPTIGELETDPPAPAGGAERLLAERDGAYGGVADPALFARLGIEPGARIRVGDATIEMRARLVSEPDKIASGIGFGPRLLVSQAALAATGLVQPGSLVRWIYRVVLPLGRDGDGEVDRLVERARQAFPEAGWDVRTRRNADPRFTANIGRFSQFLTLVGLTALLVGGVGVANAVAAFVERKRGSIAVLKSIGATGGRVVAIYLTQVMLIAAGGIAIGAAIGAALPFAVAGALRSSLPIPIAPVLSPADFGLAALYGLLTALAFSLLPLGRAHDISVQGLFRDRVAPGRRTTRPAYLAGAIAAGLALAAVAVLAAQDRRVALIFIAAAAIAFVILRLAGALIVALARRLPRSARAPVRLGVANLHRPGSLTPTLVLSLGLGVTLLVTLAVIDGSFRRELTRTLPERAPNFFFIDVPSRVAGEFRDFLGREAPGGAIEDVPMMRGRITAIRGVPVGQIKAAGEVAWVLDGDRGITYAREVPEGSSVVAGAWWEPDHRGEPLVSFDDEIAKGLGLGVGDQVGVNVLGRSLTARVANLRRIDWKRLGISFVMVFSPNAFAGAPHTDLMTLTLPPGADARTVEPRLLREAARAYPAVTSVRVKDALEAVDKVVSQLVTAIRAASAVALLASLLVLAGAVAAGHRARLYDAVVLKVLGATRGKLVLAYLVEYGVLGLATAALGTAAGLAAGAVVVGRVMGLTVDLSLGEAAASALLAVLVAVVLGLAGTWRVLGQKPASYLRSQ
ncbi:MAG: FtsX-like permease family protein [Methylobacteriaceae bacterium]|nr:FtsX-like permease family protein [Methylobacteriaceae bacterium]